MNDQNRVLIRRGARELNEQETAIVGGGPYPDRLHVCGLGTCPRWRYQRVLAAEDGDGLVCVPRFSRSYWKALDPLIGPNLRKGERT